MWRARVPYLIERHVDREEPTLRGVERALRCGCALGALRRTATVARTAVLAPASARHRHALRRFLRHVRSVRARLGASPHPLVGAAPGHLAPRVDRHLVSMRRAHVLARLERPCAADA